MQLKMAEHLQKMERVKQLQQQKKEAQEKIRERLHKRVKKDADKVRQEKLNLSEIKTMRERESYTWKSQRANMIKLQQKFQDERLQELKVVPS